MSMDLVKVGPDNYLAKLKEHVAEDEKSAALALKNATDLIIKNDEDLRIAKEDWVALRDRQKVQEESRVSITGPINDALKQINALFKGPFNAWDQARDILNKKAGDYSRKQEEIRQAKERELQEAARKEEDRIRKEKEAQERAWREKEETARREQEAAEKRLAFAKNEKARAEAAAAAEKARQEAEKAAAKAAERAQEAQTTFQPAPTVEKVEVKVAGAKKVTRYYFQVIDPKLVPVEFMGRVLRPVSDQVLGDMARALKLDNKTASPIPGVKFWSEEKMG